MSSKNSMLIQDENDEFLGERSSSCEKTQSVFCRSSECEKVNLEDFEVIKVIGKGNFGKVS